MFLLKCNLIPKFVDQNIGINILSKNNQFVYDNNLLQTKARKKKLCILGAIIAAILLLVLIVWLLN